MAAPPVGTRITQDLLLDADAIRAGARLVGDFNPLHHDAALAATTRFGGLIASGAHSSALLAGIVSILLTERGFGPAVGMDYAVQFVRPVHVGQAMRMEWVVTAITPARSGNIAVLEGQITDPRDGKPALTARMRCLFFAAPASPHPG